MNYLQQATHRIIITFHGYKTTQNVIEKLTSVLPIADNESNIKTIFANPPYNEQ